LKTFTSANLKTVFTYMFKGEDWQNKLLITAALMLVSFIIPILPLLALFGYLMKFIKNVIEGDGQPALPEWDDGRDLIRNGFKLLGLSLIFSLSLIILWIIGFGIIFSPFILMFMDSESSFMVPVGTFMLIGLFSAFGEYLMFGLSLVVVFLQSVSVCHVSVKGQFSAAFRFGEWGRILRANVGEFLLVFVIMFGLILGTNLLSSILFFLLPIVMPFSRACSVFILAPLFGQAYRTGMKKLEEAES
jgi:Protein of unknown function (DUF4013)